MKKAIDRDKLLLETTSHLKFLKSQIDKPDTDQELLKIQIMNTQSLIDSIKNNELLIG